MGHGGLPPRPWDGETPPLALCFLAGVMEEGREGHGRLHRANVRRMARILPDPGRRPDDGSERGAGGAPWPWVRGKPPPALPAEADISYGRGLELQH